MSLLQWLKNAYAANQNVVHVPDGPSTPPVRRHYRFSGLVQGVGFRYEAKRIADQLSLVGWVRNESDGTVILEVEGEELCVDAFLQAMEGVPRFDITDVQAEDLPLSGTETAFRVRY